MKLLPKTCTTVTIYFDCTGLELQLAEDLLDACTWVYVLRNALWKAHVSSVTIFRVGPCFSHTLSWTDISQVEILKAVEDVAPTMSHKLALRSLSTLPSFALY